MISILLVEDHPAFASVLVRLLRKSGDLEVTEVARTAEIALQKLPEQEFNLALVDVFLPKMSGISLVALIHEQHVLRNIQGNGSRWRSCDPDRISEHF